jgi:Inverse autotransporter, beta-domain
MKRCILALGLLLTLPAVADHSDDFWSPYAEFGTLTNGYRQGAGAMLWTPILQQECWLLYGQGYGGHWWDNWVGGLGLGYRRIIEEMAFGINGFLDAARSHHHFGYGQAGLGLEFFACGFDVFVNGYFPFEGHHTVGTSTRTEAVQGSGTELVARQFETILQERTYSGFDVMTGYCVPICGNALYLSAGYFYYSTRYAERVAGPRFGAEMRIENLAGCGTELRIGGQYEYNRVFGNYGAATVGIRIPLGCPGKAMRCCSPCDLVRRLGDPAYRGGGRGAAGGAGGGGLLNGDVIIEPDPNGNGPPPPICTGPDGQPINLYYVAGSDTGGSGSFTNPLSWEEAAALATPYDVIALLSTEGDIIAMETFVMDIGQVMVGQLSEECPEILIPCVPEGDIPLDVPLSPGRPNVVYTVDAPEDGNVITAETDTKIFGFSVNGSNDIQHIIGGEDADNVVICDITGVNTTSGFLRFQRPAGLQVLNSDFTTSANNGIFVRDPSGTITIDNNSIADVRGGNTVGINIQDINDSTILNITNNTIDGLVSEGSQMDCGILVDTQTDPLLQFDIDGNTISDVVDDGIKLMQVVTSNTKREAEGYIRNNTITRAGQYGIYVTQDTGNADHEITVEIDSNTTDDVGAEAIFVERTGNNAEGTVNATLGRVVMMGSSPGNNDINSSSNDPAYFIWNDADGDLCLTMQNNDTDRNNTFDIIVTESDESLIVYRRDDLSGDNNTLPVQLNGTIGDKATPCDTPSFGP